MSDQIFQAPVAPAPQNTQENNASVQQPTVAPQTPSAPVAPVAAPVQQPTSQETAVEPVAQQPETQAESANPNQEKINELKEKLSKVDLGQLKEKITTYLWYTLGGCFILGMMFGCSMGGSSQPQQKTQTPQGISARVVRNADITKKAGICGDPRLNPTDDCIYYVLNTAHYDKRAEDFFAEVNQKMNRQMEAIRYENPTYAQTLIRPGWFAQIKVPRM